MEKMMNNPVRRYHRFSRLLGGLLLATIGVLAAAGMGQATASLTTRTAPVPSPLHPTYALLDVDGVNVLKSGKPLSTMQTCGACHDTAYIEQHSFHADLGLADFAAENVHLAQPWDESRGVFGKWDPLTYRVLSPKGAERVDLTTVDWLRLNGARAPGGGPATTARNGDPLISLIAQAGDPETSVVDPVTGELQTWDRQKSGTMEMNCFLCHSSAPNNAARVAEIQAGKFGWANTATLLGTGIVEQTTTGYRWKPEAFDGAGNSSLRLFRSRTHRTRTAPSATASSIRTPKPHSRSMRATPRIRRRRLPARLLHRRRSPNPGSTWLVKTTLHALGTFMPSAVSSAPTAIMP